MYFTQVVVNFAIERIKVITWVENDHLKFCFHTEMSSISYKIVNRIFRGKLNGVVNLEEIHHKLISDGLSSQAKLTSSPVHVVVTFGDFKLLIFKSGKFRSMGRAQPSVVRQTLENVWINILGYEVIPTLFLQTMTAHAKLAEQINLYQLAPLIQSTYDFELFPALRITKFNPLCVNVFASGHVTIMGLKDSLVVNNILTELDECIASIDLCNIIRNTM